MPDNRQDYKIEWARKNGYKFQKDWNKKNLKIISVNLNRSTDADIIDFWERLQNKAQWFRDACRSEMQKRAE